jgi:hypothetical protein
MPAMAKASHPQDTLEEKKSLICIFYSWPAPDHERRVFALSERLMHDGIDVDVDKWNL